MTLRDIIQPKRPSASLPSAQGRWASCMDEQRQRGCSPESQLQGVEAQGASAEELAELAMDMFLPLFPRFRGLSKGYQRRDQLSPHDPEMGLWLLLTLRDGWRVLDVLGTLPRSLLARLLWARSPSEWIEDIEQLRLPSDLRGAVHPHGLEFCSQSKPLDLRWLPYWVAGSLRILGPLPGVLLPDSLTCGGELVLREVSGIQRLKGLEAKNLIVERCPDLTTIDLTKHTPIQVRACPSLTQITGKLQKDLIVEDCPELLEIDVLFPRDALPATSLVVRRCQKLGSIGRASGVPRACKNLIVEDCQSFSGFWPQLTVRWERRITGCPLVAEGL